jgi:Carbohydrate-binding module 48 (Isoamylase N-terminal domain)
MSDVERDHVLRRAVQTLRQVPPGDVGAIRRVVEAAAAQRVMPAADEPLIGAESGRRSTVRRWRLAGLGSLVAAAAVVGFIVRGPLTRSAPSGTAASSAATSSVPVQPAVNGSLDVMPIPQQFVFRSASARRVSLVGDFNAWNAASAPMVRASDGDLWSVTIPIAPGRHTYGFMVNDSVFALDPDARVARARDPDLGVEGSVVIVGRP